MEKASIAMDQTTHGTSSVEDETPRPIYLLDSDRIDFYWPKIVPLLEIIPIFCELYDPASVYSEAKMGHLQIWALRDTAIRAIVLTRINIYPRAKVFEIIGAAGTGAFKFVPDMEAMFEWIAREQNCTFFRSTVRPGIERKLKSVDGVTRMGMVLMKRITPRGVN